MKIRFLLPGLFLVSVTTFSSAQGQIDKEALSLTIGKAEEANLQKLKAYIWKRKSDAYLDGQLKLTAITEFSFDATGKVQTKMIDAQTTVKKQPGLRGRTQQSAAEDKMDYVEKALETSLQYAFMSKGQLLDFFAKAVVSQKEDGTLIATADNLYVQGDRLTVHVDPKTNLFKYKEFKSLVGKDPIDGQLNYELFSSGVSHGSTTTLNMPAQKMQIKAVNQDYSQRVN